MRKTLGLYLIAGGLVAGCTLWPASGRTAGAGPAAGSSAESTCVTCHTKTSPGIVADWKTSKHAEFNFDCSVCHGSEHQTATDAAKAKLPTPDTCAECHSDQVEQFKGGKHALAWAAIQAMPTIHWQPVALIDGLEGCGGCHQIGLKTPAEIQSLKKHGGGFGLASCDACHTRHAFSAAEARQPQACRTCHMGFDHPQWEMYESSKHGVRHELKELHVLPEQAPAPTCQTCHMPDGHHGVMTAWGFLAVRLPMPKDKQWAEDRTTILKGLGVLDPEGKPTARLEVVKEAKVARLTEAEWQQQRDRMIEICSRCHARDFATGELSKGDEMIKRADHVMAEAIRVVAGLYRDGVLRKPPTYAYAYPDLLTFFDAPTVVEQRLFRMFLEHRMRTFQGTFHASPDYAMWYGWAAMHEDLSEIRMLAQEMRSAAKSTAAEQPRR